MTRPINVIAPKGSIFNPNFPRSCFARFCQVQRAVDLVLRALAPVVPERVTAGNSAHLHFISYSGFDADQGEYWVYLEVDEGSYGGRPDRDGLDAVDCLIANTRNNPIEELEWRFPIRTERYELRTEPCAAGKWRGGIGMVRVNKMLVDTIVTCEGERHESDEPWGVFGGMAGLNASVVRNRGGADEEAWPSKFTGFRLAAGDSIEITVPNSGGYGDPLERDPRLCCRTCSTASPPSSAPAMTTALSSSRSPCGSTKRQPAGCGPSVSAGRASRRRRNVRDAEAIRPAMAVR